MKLDARLLFWLLASGFWLLHFIVQRSAFIVFLARLYRAAGKSYHALVHAARVLAARRLSLSCSRLNHHAHASL